MILPTQRLADHTDTSTLKMDAIEINMQPYYYKDNLAVFTL